MNFHSIAQDLIECDREAIHPAGDQIIIEFEPHAKDEFQNHLAVVAPVTGPLSSAQSTAELCTMAAKVLREILGSDRVVIYRFRRDDSGEVVAEEKCEDLEAQFRMPAR